MILVRTRVPSKAPMKNRSVFAAALLAGLGALLPVSANAQTVDYGSFETMFNEPVTMSVTGSPQRVSDVPGTMEIITADQIRRSGAKDIPGVLRHVGGVDVMQWANDNADVGVRGYDQAFTPRLLVLIDGRQVYADFYGYTPWSTLPVELGAIRQIEIIKGPNCALFGFNAVSGVINIVTYDALADDINTLSVIGGTQGLAAGSAVATWKYRDVLGLRLSAGYSRDDEYATPIPANEAGADRQGNERIAVNGVAEVRLSDGIILGIELSHSQNRLNQMSPAYSYVFSAFDTNSIKARLTADTSLGLMQLTAYSNWIEQKDDLGPLVVTFHNQVTVVQGQDIFQLGNDHTLRFSVEYRHNSMPSQAGGTIFYDLASSGGMWQWNILPELSLTNALRYDQIDLVQTQGVSAVSPPANADAKRTIASVAFNSGLVWRIDNENTVRLTASRGAALPSLINLDGTGPGAGGINSAFYTLQPSFVSNYEIGWDRTLSAIGGRLRINVFHQYNSNLISLGGGVAAPGSASSPPGAGNVGNSTANGVEVAVSGTFDAWRYGVSYRYEAVADDFLPAVRDGMAGIDFEHVTPTHMVNANLGWSGDDIEADIYLHAQSATEGLQPDGGNPGATRLVPVDSYVSADIRLAYAVSDKLTLAVSGQNLLAAQQQQTSGSAVERRVLATLSVGL